MVEMINSTKCKNLLICPAYKREKIIENTTKKELEELRPWLANV